MSLKNEWIEKRQPTGISFRLKEEGIPFLVTWFNLYEVYKIVKLTETESEIFARGWQER